MKLPEDLITPAEAAELLACHQGTIYRLIKAQRLPAWRRPPGRRLRVSRATVEALLEPTVTGPPPQTRRQKEAGKKRAEEVLAKAGFKVKKG